MSRVNQSFTSASKQGGSALIIATFVIVVMGLLALGLGRVIDTTSRNAAWEVLGTRADLAAFSGLEQALSQLFPLDMAENYQGQCSDIALSALQGEGFANCSVSLNCSSFNVTELDARFFELEATGQCGSGEVQVQRVQQVQARTSL